MENKKVNPKKVNTTFLSENLAVTGSLLPEAIDRTVNAIINFVNEAKSNNAEQIFIFGTEAMRSGKNAYTVIEKVKSATGINIDVISGEDEALCGFVGANTQKNKVCVIDIGGASIELVQGQEKIEKGVSLPIGVMRVKNICGNDREKIHAYYNEQIKKYPLFSYDAVGIGGTATSLSAMIKRMDRYDATLNHGSIITLAQLKQLENEIFALNDSNEIAKIFPSIGEKRARVIGVGCIALVEILEYLNKTELVVSEHDNIEGYYALKTRK
jgi:exopolyphosphatase/guanosine-5'-triphosphate,3'-diphosphate pyrophosphatase